KAVAAQTTATAAATAANKAQTGADLANSLVSQASGTGNVRLGAQNTGRTLDVRNQGNLTRTLSGVTDGALSATSTDAVTGKQLHATDGKVTAADNKAVAAQTTATAAATAANKAQTGADLANSLVSQVSGTGNVRLGAQNTGRTLDVRNQGKLTRTVSGVTDGALSATSTDAVTGGQLFATNEVVKSQQEVVAGNTRLIGDNRSSIATLRTDLDAATADLDYAVMFNKERTVVDLGNARISGLAAGDISRADSRDAVNGGQLFATNARVGDLEEQRMFVKVGYDDESVEARAGLFGIALGDSAEASVDTEGAVALGSFAVARGKNSVALGRAAYVHAGAEEGFALGASSHVEVTGGVALGASSVVQQSARDAVALGYGSVATEANTISVGSDTRKRRVVNMARGTVDSDATTVAQLKGALDGLGGGATVDATGAITAPAYVLSSNTYNNVGDALLALDSAVVTTKSDVDALGNQVNRLFQEEASTRTDGPGRLNLGGAHGMVLGNVADGRIGAGSRDAVNGGQLHATNQKVGENRSEISDLRAALDGMQPRAARSSMVADAPVVDFGGSRLAGVGAGDISSVDSKDAVNGGQLFATNARVGYLEDQQRYAAVGSDEYSQAARAGWGGVAIGDTAEASVDGEGGTAVGSFSKALADNSVALGRAAYVRADAVNGFALGTRSRVQAANGVALGADTEVRAVATNGVALGYGSIATEADTLSIGSDTLKRRIVNLGAGIADDNATTVAQLKGALDVLGGGASIDATGAITAPEYVLSGGTYDNFGTALLALDATVVTTQADMDALGSQVNRLFQEEASTRSDGPGRLNLGGAHGMVLGNVANGLIASGSRDAVNGGQLYEVQKNLQGQIDTLEGRGSEPVAMMGRMGTPVETPVDTPVAKVDTPEPVVKADGDNAVAVGSEGKERSVRHVAKGTADTDAVNVRQLNDVLTQSNEYTDLAVEGLNKRLDGMDKRFNRMAAMSSAQSAMAMNTAGLNTYNRLGAGVGHSDGESALAVGYQRVMNERGSATFSLNGAFTNSGEKTVGVGVGIGW
ncbi:MAG: YadA-like family protein, partial [Gammaproteobacteria bacterium]|nr:YadA-like family protein [Gammaproteobacteria bacterium]